MNWKYSGQQHLAYNTNKTKKDTFTCRNEVVRYVQKYLSLEISVQILLQNCEQFLNTFDPFCELFYKIRLTPASVHHGCGRDFRF